MTVLDSIDKKLEKWKSEKAYGYFVVQYDYRPSLYIGRESWNMLRAEIGEFIGFVRCAEKNNSFYGMDVVIVDKNFYLEVE